MTKEIRYIQKIENDVKEHMYELLVIHLLDVDKKIDPTKVLVIKRGDEEVNIQECQEKLISLINSAIEDILSKLDNKYRFNKIQYYRYILIFCNKILRYRPSFTKYKEIKNSIIKEFTQSEEEISEKIPNKNQMNEVRLTFDTDYLKYKIKANINISKWQEALYCLLAVKLIEPDFELLDKYYNTIKENMNDEEIHNETYKYPKSEKLILDANMLIYELDSKFETSKFHKLIENNELFVTPSVIDEVNSNLEYKYVQIKRQSYKAGTNPEEKIEEIQSKWQKLLEKIQKIDVKVNEEVTESIKKFYRKFPNKLEELAITKLRDNYVTYKLRKLAQREDLYPEEGDMNLLAEAILINKEKEENYSICSKDKDFTEFSGNIEKEFGVKIYN